MSPVLIRFNSRVSLLVVAFIIQSAFHCTGSLDGSCAHL